MIRLAEDWRQAFRFDKEEGQDATIVVRIPASVREFLDHVVYEKGGNLSELVRAALIDWVLAESTPNLKARRQWLEGLAAIYSTTQEDMDNDADWADTNPLDTQRLAAFVRQTDADWARRDRKALNARKARMAAELESEARDLALLEAWKQGAGEGKTFEQFLADSEREADGDEK